MRFGTRFPLTSSVRGIVERLMEGLATPVLTFDRSLIALMMFSGLPKSSRRREFKVRFIVLGRWTPSGYLMRSSSTWSRAEAAWWLELVEIFTLCHFEGSPGSLGIFSGVSSTFFLLSLSQQAC